MNEPQRRIDLFTAIALLAFSGIIDIAQILLDFLLVGVVVNRAIDLFIGLLLIYWFYMLSVLNVRVGIALGISFIAEFMPVIDVAPLWTLDVIYTLVRIHKEDTARIAAYRGEAPKKSAMSSLGKAAAVAGGGAAAASTGAGAAGGAAAGSTAGAKTAKTGSQAQAGRSVGGRFAPANAVETSQGTRGVTEPQSADIYKSSQKKTESQSQQNPFSQDSQAKPNQNNPAPSAKETDEDRKKRLHEAVNKYDFKREEREREEARQRGIRDRGEGQEGNPQGDTSDEPELVL